MGIHKKQEVITFKVDPALSRALQGVENRSEFIRSAILAAIDHACPLCKGTGLLTPDQRRHWDEFALRHHVQQCNECEAMHLVCEAVETLPPAPVARAPSQPAKGA